MENLSRNRGAVGDGSLHQFDCLFRGSFDWPADHKAFPTAASSRCIQSALDHHKCLESFPSKGFRAAPNFESKLPLG